MILNPQEKITLFKAIFAGRTDVFAQHWISWDGKKQGWFPVHTDRTNSVYAPLTDSILEEHLRGHKTVGAYPLLTNNTSFFVAADFDGNNWKNEVGDIVSVSKEYHLPAYIERSRSGNGAHVWWFFETPYPAFKSRSIFLRLLSLSNSIDPLNGEKSFDRIFPNQDYLSGKGLGNLIALPLQGTARKNDNTVFLDLEHNFTPFTDQWSFLQTIQKIPIIDLENIYTDLIEHRKINSSTTKYTGSDLPITVDTHIGIPKTFMFKELATFLGEQLNFFNTEYAVKQRMGLSTYGTERYFKMIENDDENILLPHGFLDILLRFLNEQKIPYQITDGRHKDKPTKFNFSCSLFDYQITAINAFKNIDTGILVAPPGSGKTIMGLALVAEKQQSTLIIAHRKQIADQWVERIEHFLNIQKKIIGQVVGAKKKIQLPITVAMVQSLARLENLNEFASQFGTVIVDECHHMPAKMFRRAINQLKPTYLYGLTATPDRKHSDERLIFIYLGEIIHEVKNILNKNTTEIMTTATANATPHEKPSISIIVRSTALNLPFKISARNSQSAIKSLCFDTARNQQIINDIKQSIQSGKKCLVLTERKEHVDLLAEYLKRDFEIITMTGDLAASKKKYKEKQILSGHFQIILATGQLVGEGVHFPHLDTLFLVYPFSFEGKLIQYLGRILHSNSMTKMVYDYHDELVPYFERMFKQRKKYYNKHYPSEIKL